MQSLPLRNVHKRYGSKERGRNKPSVTANGWSARRRRSERKSESERGQAGTETVADVSTRSLSHHRKHSDFSRNLSLQTATGSIATEEGTTGRADTGGGTTVGIETGDRKTIGAVARTKASRQDLVPNETRHLHLAPRMIGRCPHHLCPPEVLTAMVTVPGA